MKKLLTIFTVLLFLLPSLASSRGLSKFKQAAKSVMWKNMLRDIYLNQQKVHWFPEPLAIDGHDRVVQNMAGAGGLPEVKYDISSAVNVAPTIGMATIILKPFK